MSTQRVSTLTVQIQCINKTHRTDPAERIASVGGVNPDRSYTTSISRALAFTMLTGLRTPGPAHPATAHVCCRGIGERCCSHPHLRPVGAAWSPIRLHLGPRGQVCCAVSMALPERTDLAHRARHQPPVARATEDQRTRSLAVVLHPVVAHVHDLHPAPLAVREHAHYAAPVMGSASDHAIPPSWRPAWSTSW